MGEIKRLKLEDLSPKIQSRLQNPIPLSVDEHVAEYDVLVRENITDSEFNLIESSQPLFRNWEKSSNPKKFLTRFNSSIENVTDDPESAIFIMVDKGNFPSDWNAQKCQNVLNKWCALNELAIKKYEPNCPRLTAKVMVQDDYKGGYNPTEIFNQCEDREGSSLSFNFGIEKSSVPRIILDFGSIDNQLNYQSNDEFENPEFYVVYCQIGENSKESEISKIINNVSNGYLSFKKTGYSTQNLTFMLKLATCLLCSNVKSDQTKNLITQFCFETYNLAIKDKESKNTSIGTDLMTVNNDRSINFDAVMTPLSIGWKDNGKSAYKYLKEFDSTIKNLHYDKTSQIRKFFERIFNQMKKYNTFVFKKSSAEYPGSLRKKENRANYYKSILQYQNQLQESNLKRLLVEEFKSIFWPSDSDYDLNEEFKVIKRVWLSMIRLSELSNNSFKVSNLFNHVDIVDSIHGNESDTVLRDMEIDENDVYLFENLDINFNLVGHFYSYNTFRVFFDELKQEISNSDPRAREHLVKIFGLEPIKPIKEASE